MFPTRKPLSKDDEEGLVQRMKAGDKEAADALVRQWGRLAVDTALRTASKHYTEGADLEDLIGWGLQGLVLGLKAYDPSRGVRISTCLYLWIREYIRKGMRSHRFIRLPADALHIYYTLLFVVGRDRLDLTDEKAWEAALPEVRKSAGKVVASTITLERLKEVFKAASTSQTFHLDYNVPKGNSAQGTTLSHMAAPLDSLPKKSKVEHELADAVREAVADLDERSKAIIMHLYGLQNYDTLNLVALGRKFNLSRERIRQIEAVALDHLQFVLKDAVRE
jgi:RNA polymerase sigma factor (sigma-70 family)